MSRSFIPKGVLCICLTASVAVAQPQPPHPPGPPPGPDLGKWWKDSEIAGALGLSDAQTRKIEEAFFEHRIKLIDLRAELERQETRLQPLLDADQPDEAKVGAQIDLVLAARGRLEKANAMMMLAIRKVLSTEQWRKLESIKQERERRHTPAPPGPPRQPGQPHVPQPPQSPGTPRVNPPPEPPEPPGREMFSSTEG
jgi:Spy/CpxP family protein refolding chaperone